VIANDDFSLYSLFDGGVPGTSALDPQTISLLHVLPAVLTDQRIKE
jgi:hypothetical protein